MGLGSGKGGEVAGANAVGSQACLSFFQRAVSKKGSILLAMEGSDVGECMAKGRAVGWWHKRGMGQKGSVDVWEKA